MFLAVWLRVDRMSEYVRSPTCSSLLRGIAPMRRDDGSSTVAKFAADLRPSSDGSAVGTPLVAGGG